MTKKRTLKIPRTAFINFSEGRKPNNETGNHEKQVHTHPSSPEPQQRAGGRKALPVKEFDNVINDNR